MDDATHRPKLSVQTNLSDQNTTGQILPAVLQPKEPVETHCHRVDYSQCWTCSSERQI